jgi:hypothetical protein
MEWQNNRKIFDTVHLSNPTNTPRPGEARSDVPEVWLIIYRRVTGDLLSDLRSLPPDWDCSPLLVACCLEAMLIHSDDDLNLFVTFAIFLVIFLFALLF